MVFTFDGSTSDKNETHMKQSQVNVVYAIWIILSFTSNIHLLYNWTHNKTIFYISGYSVLSLLYTIFHRSLEYFIFGTTASCCAFQGLTFTPSRSMQEASLNGVMLQGF